MSDFVLHPAAYDDLDEIWEYLNGKSPEAAERFLEEIYSSIRKLVSFPHQGHSRPDLTSHAVRFQLVREYLIAYVPEERPLLVLAVLHGRRHPRVIAALLRERDK